MSDNPNKDRFEMEGVVVDVLPGTKFKVHLNDVDRDIICTMSGRLRQNYIRIINGDKVTVDMSAADLTKGRIVWRDQQWSLL